MSEYEERPKWWPENPYPESVFTMTTDEYVEAIPGDHLRTAISGYMSRFGWEVADHDIYAQVEEQAIIPLEEAQARIKALEENIASQARLIEKALTRNGALEGVVEAAKRIYNAVTLIPNDEIQGCREALEIALAKLEEVKDG